MPTRELVFERDYDLPPVIVWDALVDPALVEGWLGQARIDPTPGGAYDLDWLGAREFPPTAGVIEAISEPTRLTVSTDAHGQLDFVLDRLDGGSRGTSTRLRLTVCVDLDDAFEARVRANWSTALDQLARLLRGHPVDWYPTAPHRRAARAVRDAGLA